VPRIRQRAVDDRPGAKVTRRRRGRERQGASGEMGWGLMSWQRSVRWMCGEIFYGRERRELRVSVSEIGWSE